MADSSKKLVRDLFELKELSRAPFIPWVCSFAAKLEQVPFAEMLSDAGSLSRSLINAQKLFGYDAIANVFDPSLEAEACGCEIEWRDEGELPEVISHPLSDGAPIDSLDISDFDKRGRVPVVLDATKRIKAIRGKDVAIVGVVTGPLTLARHLRGDAFADDLNQGREEAAKLIAATGNVALKLCRAYCELGVDVVAVADETLGRVEPRLVQAVSAPLRSIWNVARFYNVRSLIVSRGCSQEHVGPILALQPDGVVLSGHIDYAKLKEEAGQRKACYACVVPGSALLPRPSHAEGGAARPCPAGGKAVFVSTDWEVPYPADLNRMHEVMRVI